MRQIKEKKFVKQKQKEVKRITKEIYKEVREFVPTVQFETMSVSNTGQVKNERKNGKESCINEFNNRKT